MTDLTNLFFLARNISDSQYFAPDPPLSLSSIQREIIDAAKKGQYYMVHLYPEALLQSINSTGVPEFNIVLLNYYKSASSELEAKFKDTPFVLSSVPGGFKVSWSQLPGDTNNATQTPPSEGPTTTPQSAGPTSQLSEQSSDDQSTKTL